MYMPKQTARPLKLWLIICYFPLLIRMLSVAGMIIDWIPSSKLRTRPAAVEYNSHSSLWWHTQRPSLKSVILLIDYTDQCFGCSVLSGPLVLYFKLLSWVTDGYIWSLHAAMFLSWLSIVLDIRQLGFFILTHATVPPVCYHIFIQNMIQPQVFYSCVVRCFRAVLHFLKIPRKLATTINIYYYLDCIHMAAIFFWCHIQGGKLERWADVASRTNVVKFIKYVAAPWNMSLQIFTFYRLVQGFLHVFGLWVEAGQPGENSTQTTMQRSSQNGTAPAGSPAQVLLAISGNQPKTHWLWDKGSWKCKKCKQTSGF